MSFAVKLGIILAGVIIALIILAALAALAFFTPAYGEDSYILDPTSTSDMTTCTTGVSMGLSSSATNGTALKMTGTSTRNCTKNFTTATNGQDIVVRARGIGTTMPTMNIYLDNVLMGTFPMTATTFGDFTSVVSVPAGSHTLKVEATNMGSGRELWVDTMRIPEGAATTTPEPTPPPSCDVVASPADNLVTLANNNAAGSEFCLQDGNYTAGANIPVQSGDVWRGIYSDGTRPEVSTTTAQLLFNAEGSTGATIRDLSISGGAGPVGCKPKCGRGVHGGANLLLDNVRVHNAANQGVGGQEDGLVIQNSELDNNGYGSDGYFYLDSSSASAAGVKTINTFKVLNSNVHDNSWNGVWCDLDCDYMEVRDSTIERNGKSGIFYEVTTGTTSPESVVEGNTIRDNGDVAAPMNRQPAGLSVNSSTNLDAFGNTFGSNVQYGFWAIDDSRAPATSGISFHDNTMNGDGLRGCAGSGTGALPGVTCSNNN